MSGRQQLETEDIKEKKKGIKTETTGFDRKSDGGVRVSRLHRVTVIVTHCHVQRVLVTVTFMHVVNLK